MRTGEAIRLNIKTQKAYKRYDNRIVSGTFFYREVNEFFKKFSLVEGLE